MLRIKQGTTWSRSWPITQDGLPVNFTGWSARGQVRATAESEIVLHEWIGELADSTLTISHDPADSAAWEWRTGVYDIELTDPDGRVARIAEGRVMIIPEVTR